MSEIAQILKDMNKRRREGYDAFRLGIPDNENPYYDYDASVDWDDGWIIGWRAEEFAQSKKRESEMYQPIEKMIFDKCIWILKYDMYCKDGKFCDKDTPCATKFTDCHGWYDSEENAIKVRNHLGLADYHIEKVYKRELI